VSCGAWIALHRRGMGSKPRVRSIWGGARKTTVFTRQMATLLRAEVPLLRGLETLLKQTPKGPYREVVQDLAEHVRGGNRFSQGLAAYPALFDSLLLNMVKAGEASGQLAEVLSRVAEYREKSNRIVRRVVTAMVYPAIVLCVAVVIVALLMGFVIPQFEEVYASTLGGRSLPAMTQILIDASRFVQGHYVWLLLGVLGLMFAVRAFFRTAVGRAFRDRVTFTLPLVKALTQRLAVARFARTFGTLVESGVPILEALTIARNVVGHSLVQRALDTVHDQVKDGDPLAASLEQQNVFPAFVPSMIGVGEETGRLGEMCERVADTYEEEVDNLVGALTALLEPLMIVLLALIVGSIVIALFLPIASIFQQGGFGR
jgi:type IV pilus assembly protein PilC